MSIVNLGRCMLRFMLKKNLFRKFTSAILGIFSLTLPVYTGKLCDVTPNIAKKVLSEDQSRDEKNQTSDDKSVQAMGTDVCSDEDVPTFGSEEENE